MGLLNKISKLEELNKHIQSIEKNVDLISDDWVKSELVVDVLNRHDVNIEYFKEQFAVNVIKYFIGVVKNEVEIGNCPVIKKLLEYLKEKNITADELFVICTHARKAMLHAMFNLHIESKELLDEISLVFDLNFNSVLMEYTNSVYILEKQVENQFQEIQKKDQLIMQKSRLAAMGEMVSMIAHQWRQPLGTIASLSINLKFISEFKTYDLKKYDDVLKYESEVNTTVDKINNIITLLSTTIDDFRNFFKPNKRMVKGNLYQISQKALEILQPSIEEAKIEVLSENISSSELDLYDSELIQVILNLIKNSIDKFKEKNFPNPKIKIRTDKNVLFFCDNGGSIDEEIIDKIFEPYFSTKNEKVGTGLGLHMSKIIIEDHHGGKLNVENINNGVCFKITLNAI